VVLLSFAWVMTQQRGRACPNCGQSLK